MATETQQVTNTEKQKQTTWWQQRYFTPAGVEGYLHTYSDVLTPEVSRSEVLAALSAPEDIFGEPFAPNARKLDGFCGTARHSKQAVEAGHNNWYAVDYSAEMLERARVNLNGHAAHINLSRQDAKNMTFPDHSFAYYQVLGNSALGLFTPEDDVAILREAHRVLQPGGYFVFDNPNLTYAREQLTDHCTMGVEENTVVVKKRATRQTDEGTVYTGHREYRFTPHTTLPESNIDIVETDNAITVTHNGNVIETHPRELVNIQEIRRTLYTPEQIFALMEAAGFEPAMIERAYVYAPDSDRFGTMGVRDIFVGRKKS